MLIGIRECGWYVALLGVLFIGLFALLPSNSASALTNEDLGIINTSSITLGQSTTVAECELVDFTDKITTDLYENSSNDYSRENLWSQNHTLLNSHLDEFKTNYDGVDNNYAIAEVEVFPGTENSYNELRLYVFDKDASFSFVDRYGTGDYRLASTHQLYWINIFYNPNSNCRYQASSTIESANYNTNWGGYNIELNSPISGNISWFDFPSENITYPEGYEGDGIGQVEGKPSLYPHYTYLVTDKEIKANNDVTQELPDLPEPDEGWQNNEWQIMWYLFKCDEIDDDNIINCPDREMINSELLSRDEEYNWEVEEYGDYLLIAEFRYQSCYRYASWPATPDNCILNSEHDDYSFVPGRTVYLPIDGMNIVGDTSDLDCDVAGYCYDETRFKDCNVVVAIATLSFDEFNYADCLENISLLANLLSFDTIKFSNSWVSSGNCYTLGTLGNWLNLDNKLVCPYFSNEVRNTVTPFITFLLGLIMVRFIAGKGSHGTMREDI